MEIEEIYNYQATKHFKEEVRYGTKSQEDVMSKNISRKNFYRAILITKLYSVLNVTHTS